MPTSSLSTEINEITTCPICFEEFTSPKLLDCPHSFCLKCLQDHCGNKHPGAKTPCPLCRTEFVIPPNGLEGLRPNLVLQNLIDAKRASAEKRKAKPCEVCSTDEQFVRATVFCMDCSQRLCERCSLPHKRWGGGAHVLKPLGDEQILKQVEGKLMFVLVITTWCY